MSHIPVALPEPGLAPEALDLHWMQQALALAAHARDRYQEVPVAALVVRGAELLGVGWNRSIVDHDASAHAEIVALRAAGRHCGNYRLPGAQVYVTLEPCVMCAGAIIHARIERVVYAAADPKTGAAGSVFDTLISERHNHRVSVEAGLCAEQAGDLLRDFFRQRRKAAPQLQQETSDERAP